MVSDYPDQDRAAGLVKADVGGRFVTKYDPSVALQIVEKVAEGETLSKICAKGTGMPHRVTFKRWLVNNPDLAKAYATAKELSAQSFEEEALDMAREIRSNPGTGTKVRAFEVALNQLRWSASHRDPGRFGSQTNVSVRVPIQINTTLDLGHDAPGNIDSADIYNIGAKHARSETQALIDVTPEIEYKPLVPEEPIRRTRLSPFQKRSIIERDKERAEAIRSRSNRRGNDQGNRGVQLGDQGNDQIPGETGEENNDTE